MSDLVQHVFECRQCSQNRPCIHIYVERDLVDITDIKKHVSTVHCSFSNSKFEHQYSIPYDGD